MARCTGAVINVLTAVVPSPTIHTHALVTAIGVVACATILAGVGHQLALINVLCAKLACGRTRGQRVQVYSPNMKRIKPSGSYSFFFLFFFYTCIELFLYRPVNSGLHWQL